MRAGQPGAHHRPSCPLFQAGASADGSASPALAPAAPAEPAGSLSEVLPPGGGGGTWRPAAAGDPRATAPRVAGLQLDEGEAGGGAAGRAARERGSPAAAGPVRLPSEDQISTPAAKPAPARRSSLASPQPSPAPPAAPAAPAAPVRNSIQVSVSLAPGNAGHAPVLRGQEGALGEGRVHQLRKLFSHQVRWPAFRPPPVSCVGLRFSQPSAPPLSPAWV
jgi:hypothetical protein